MRRRLVIVAVIALGTMVGVLLAPVVFGPLPSRGPAVVVARPVNTATPPTAEPSTSVTPTLSAAEQADLAAGVLATMPARASGELQVLPGSLAAPDPGAEEVVRVRVETERGLPVDAAAFGAFVMTTLNDPRGWGHDGAMSFARTDGEADVRVVLASPALVDRMCAPLRTAGLYSCGRNGHAALNAQRWGVGAEPFLAGGGDLTTYRQYLVTHEVGHLFGNPHQECPAAGAPAPVMVQQSISLGGCLPNAWVRADVGG